MKILFDRDLIESAFLAANPPDLPERDRIYDLTDPQAREEAFAAFHAGWFQNAGLEAAVSTVFAAWPLLAAHCAEVVVRRVHHAKDEFAELFRVPGGPARIGLGLRPGRLVRPGFAPFLHRECAHLSDMFDPHFAYPAELPSDHTPAAHLRRDRYRVLWDLAIEARLARCFPDEPAHVAALDGHHRAWLQTFSFLNGEELKSIEARLTGEPGPTHPELWALADDPRHLREKSDVRVSGGTCPVCGFTTFDWAAAADVRQAAAAIRGDFPDWDVEDACCARCAEVYLALRHPNIPPTILLPPARLRSCPVGVIRG